MRVGAGTERPGRAAHGVGDLGGRVVARSSRRRGGRSARRSTQSAKALVAAARARLLGAGRTSSGSVNDAGEQCRGCEHGGLAHVARAPCR